MFLLTKYDDHEWIQNFIMSKEMLFIITNKLKPLIAKKGTRYYFIIHVKFVMASVI
jgi:hypothetical protein